MRLDKELQDISNLRNPLQWGRGLGCGEEEHQQAAWWGWSDFMDEFLEVLEIGSGSIFLVEVDLFLSWSTIEEISECMLFLGFPLREDLQAEWGHGESRNNYKLMLHVIAIAWWLTKDTSFDVDVVFYCNHIVHWNHASDPGVQCSWNHQRCKPSHQWTQVSTYFLACIFISCAWN